MRVNPVLESDGSPLHFRSIVAGRMRTALNSLQGVTETPSARGTFQNPIIAAPCSAPWVIAHEGFYYYCESRNQESIHIRKAECLTGLGESFGVQIWSSPAMGGNSKAVWAPELHHFNGRWHIYYAADDGLNENHRMWALESMTDDPLGEYRCRGQLETGGWAIDGTVLDVEGSLYFIWSGWPGPHNGRQNLYIAPMSSPRTIAGERVLLAEPSMPWEMSGMEICEAPQILRRDGRIFLVYSASASWTEDYCMGLLEFHGGDPLDPGRWVKAPLPVFAKTSRVWGVGHASFVKSPDGSEDWMVYHVKTKPSKGWNDRSVHAQKFSWTPEGLPFFANPTPAGLPLPRPSSLISVAR